MIKISFQNGNISEITCESAREVSEIVSSMKSSYVPKTTTVATPAASKATRKRAPKHYRTIASKNGKRRVHPVRQGWWNLEEVKFIIENKDTMDEAKLATSPYLMQRHVPSAVYRVISEINDGGKFPSKRLAQLYREATKEVAPVHAATEA